MLEVQKELLRHEEAPERILVSMTKKDDKMSLTNLLKVSHQGMR